jgi:hypothetical protein
MATQPIEDGAEVAVKTTGKNEKFVFLANFYKVLIKSAPLAAGGKVKIRYFKENDYY